MKTQANQPSSVADAEQSPAQSNHAAAAHTPGPWAGPLRYGNTGFELQVPVAGKRDTWKQGPILRNCTLEDARLIAAAPELLKAAQAALKFMDERWPNMDFGIPQDLRAAIAKARGE